ncbi:cell differentiation protein RCD1 homolog [Solanum tuberosum]|uniref:cell differentiation protein RCD1 homolog n=1 Tax=Solanum tuberosum TaxID=4113 RepID=UPI0003D27919|nr:PREDICTED: cell differentiation protein RCD1 homolog [Solanum tuberosum]
MSNPSERRYRAEQLIMNLGESSIREDVLIELNNFIIEQSTEAMRMDLGFHLWNSELTLTILLQEVVAVYPKLLDPTLTMAECTRLCNALNVIQVNIRFGSVVWLLHPDARIGLLKANIPYFLNPFLRISENVMRPLRFVTLSILNLISALAKFDESYGQEILLLLLDTQVVPLCMHCILHGDQLIRKVATLILMKILMQEKGLKYCCALPARFLLVIQVLRQLVDTFTSEIPCSQQLKYVVQCYLSLSRVAWVGGVYDTVRTNIPKQLIDNTFGIITRDDPEFQICCIS